MSVVSRETLSIVRMYGVQCDHVGCCDSCVVTANRKREVSNGVPDEWVVYYDRHGNAIKFLCPNHANDLHWTKSGLANLNMLIRVSFIKLGYSKGLPPALIAKKMGVPEKVVYVAAHKYKFSVKQRKRYPMVPTTKAGIQRNAMRREQNTRNKTVPVTLPGPDWAKS